MSEAKERRHSERQITEGTGLISFGREPVSCRVIDVSDNGAQVRIDGRRASRQMMGKRMTLVMDGGAASGEKASPVEGRVVWVRPAVNGVYLGIEIIRSERKSAEDSPR
jgi:hypothetical protein